MMYKEILDQLKCIRREIKESNVIVNTFADVVAYNKKQGKPVWFTVRVDEAHDNYENAVHYWNGETLLWIPSTPSID